MGPDYFISYAQADYQWAEWIAWVLEESDRTVWIQQWDSVPGTNWLEIMDRASRMSTRTIAVLSPDYVSSSSFGAEWREAYRRQQIEGGRRLIPVRVEDFRPTGLLAGVVYLDLCGIPRSDAQKRLLAAVASAEKGRNKPSAAPPFPGDGTIDVNPLEVDDDPVARSAYQEQVRQIAPAELLGREQELADLTTFCLDDGPDNYAWWRAPAWSGKSALVSWFALHPPPSVRVVSFFVTARWRGNNDRAAFTEVVTVQLAELLDRPIPPFISEHRQEAELLSLLAEAAQACMSQSQRLVLLVDGLDEDQGVTTGAEARSIAALLPEHPPEGLRIILAGRPDPPVPADVPPRHALRDKRIVRALRPSRHAVVLRGDMRRELQRMRRSAGLERDLLGFLTAAGGGLSATDLSELVADPEVIRYDIDELLSSVSGRSFTSRLARWGQETRLVYVLGHEELQREATDSYGRHRLAGYRARIHAWADEYREKDWPERTPEYLLRAYFQLLLETQDEDGNLDRIVAFAADLRRHDRMLDLTGGDANALSEVTEAQKLLLAQARPNLSALARLAVHRSRITERNANIPTRLPAAWAALGNPGRGDSLARAIANPYLQAKALRALVTRLCEVLDLARAAQAARAIPTGSHQADALCEVATAASAAGEFDTAIDIAADIDEERHQRGQALRVITHALADRGRPIDAEKTARQISGRAERARALAAVANSFAGTGDDVRAAPVVNDAEQVARELKHSTLRAEVLADIATALNAPSQADHALRIANSIEDTRCRAKALGHVAANLARIGDIAAAEDVVEQIDDPRWRAHGQESLVAALIDRSDEESAASLAARIRLPDIRASALVRVALALRRGGSRARADELQLAGERVARHLTHAGHQAQALLGVLRLELTESDEPARLDLVRATDQAIGAVTHPIRQAQARLDLLELLIDGGAADLARERIGDAERIIHAVNDGAARAELLVSFAQALVRAGANFDAERITHAVGDSSERLRLLAFLAAALNASQHHSDADRLLAQAEQIPLSSNDTEWRAGMYVVLAQALSDNGASDDGRRYAEAAEEASQAVADPARQVLALAALAQALARVGSSDQARDVAEVAAKTASTADPRQQSLMHATAARSFAYADDEERAEKIAEGLRDRRERDTVRRILVVTKSRGGRLADAQRIAESIGDPLIRGNAISSVVEGLAHEHRFEDAGQLALSIGDAAERCAALSSLAGIALTSHDLSRARDAARAVVDATDANMTALDRDSLLARIVAVIAHTDGSAHARSIAERIANRHDRATGIARIAENLRVDSPPDERQAYAMEAFAVAMSTRTGAQQTMTLATVLPALAAAGDHHGLAHATSIVDTGIRNSTNPDQRLKMLLVAVPALVKSGQKERAKTLTAFGLSVHSWEGRLLELVTDFEPDAPSAIARQLLGP